MPCPLDFEKFGGGTYVLIFSCLLGNFVPFHTVNVNSASSSSSVSKINFSKNVQGTLGRAYITANKTLPQVLQLHLAGSSLFLFFLFSLFLFLFRRKKNPFLPMKGSRNIICYSADSFLLQGSIGFFSPIPWSLFQEEFWCQMLG